MKTVLMAGGRGTRISSIASGIPKPMIPIAGKPVLEWELACLKSQGFTDIIITAGHLASVITDYFGDGSRVSPATGQPFGVNIQYYIEKTPLGNAGAVFRLWEEGLLGEDFLLLIADAMFDIDFHRFVRFHRDHCALATVFTHPNSHPYDSGLVVADEESHRITSWLNKEDARPQYYKNRASAGLHILSPDILKMSCMKTGSLGAGRKADLDRDILKPMVHTQAIYAYDSPEYCHDMGTPERFHAVSCDVESGRAGVLNLRRRQKAVFLERDGMLGCFDGFFRNQDSFKLLPYAAEAVKHIHASGYLVIAVAGQPDPAQRDAAAEQLISNKMETLLGREGAYVDAVYYDRCDCSETAADFFVKAVKDYHIDLKQSFMISGSMRNRKAALSFGCKTILLTETGGEEDAAAGGQASSLSEAVRIIIDDVSGVH